MYIITNQKDLIDKEIAFVDMPRFNSPLTMITKDKGIMVFMQYGEADDFEVDIFSESRVIEYILWDQKMKNRIVENGVISMQEMVDFEKEYENKVEALLTR